MSKNLADNIVALRKKHGLSQEQFAEKIGVTRQAVSNWECRIATPDVETLDLIAKLFDTDLTALVNGESTAAEKPKDKMTFSKNEFAIFILAAHSCFRLLPALGIYRNCPLPCLRNKNLIFAHRAILLSGFDTVLVIGSPFRRQSQSL